MIVSKNAWLGLLGSFLAIVMVSTPASAQQQQRRPNILAIMGDDVGWFNVGAYHQGIMSGKTPNLDRLTSEGMRFTDYYAEASCTAGRANFIPAAVREHVKRAEHARPAFPQGEVRHDDLR